MSLRLCSRAPTMTISLVPMARDSSRWCGQLSGTTPAVAVAGDHGSPGPTRPRQPLFQPPDHVSLSLQRRVLRGTDLAVEQGQVHLLPHQLLQHRSGPSTRALLHLPQGPRAAFGCSAAPGTPRCVTTSLPTSDSIRAPNARPSRRRAKTTSKHQQDQEGQALDDESERERPVPRVISDSSHGEFHTKCAAQASARAQGEDAQTAWLGPLPLSHEDTRNRNP